ncbi:MAG: sigma-70 family RNA polymerase sigma factor [Fibrobacterales bacterium]
MNNRQLENLFMQFSPLAFSVSVSVLHSREEAEDVVQELFLNRVPKMMERYSTVSPEEMGRIIARSAKNLSIDMFRKKRRYPEQQILESDAVTEVENPTETPEVTTFLDAVNETDREVLTLKYLNKLTWSQVAEILGLSEVGSRKRGRIALERIKNLVKRG